MKFGSHTIIADHSFALLVEDEKGSKGLLSNKQFSKGDVISPFYAREVLHAPTYLTVQLSDREHILLGPEFLQYVNHSCDPSAFFDTTEMKLIALKDLQPGDPITFFYPSTEWKMDRAFECLCGAPSCIGKIQGALYLTSAQHQHYKLNKYILHKIQESNAGKQSV
ncbi:hypothetical protein LBMAG23_01560 [Bacteroidota bacterium]|nr:hypothetical protein LBMAG23_01560 [Bacteroidota bacterium]